MPGASEPMTRHRHCLIDGQKFEGPSAYCTCKFFWCSIGKPAMRPFVIVIVTPALQFFACVCQIEKDLAVETFVAEAAIEALDIAILDRPAWPNEI